MLDQNRQIGKLLNQISKTRGPEAVEALYDLIAPTIRHIGLKYLHELPIAEDFVQDFWADIYRIADCYRFSFNPFGYLCKVATNRAINHYHQLKSDAAKVLYVDYSAFRQADIYKQAEIHIILEAALNALSETERIIIQSTYYEQKTVRQIANELGISKSQVARLKARALSKLEGQLKEAGL